MRTAPFENAPIDAGPSELAPGEEASGPEELKIQQAMDYYRAALRTGPRPPREVLAEGKRLGHTKRTQERARSRLRVQTIPPTTWQGPWQIALPGDPTVEAAKQRRKEKERKKQQRQVNGRKRNGVGTKPRHEWLAPDR